MNKIIKNWRNPKKLKKILAVVGAVLVVIIGASAYFYYSNYQEQEKKRLVKQRQEQQERNNKKSITDFYVQAFSGASIDQFVNLLKEINLSRIRLEQSGFNETQYNCNASTCDFYYQLRPDAIFNVQSKMMFNQYYEPSFSASELSYSGIDSNMKKNKILELFDDNQEIKAPLCSDMLNFFYSYNSSQKSNGIVLKSLPMNRVESQEKSYPTYQHSLGLMIGEIAITQSSDSPLIMQAFWDKKPYRDYFLISEVSKQGTNSSISVTGKFICKK